MRKTLLLLTFCGVAALLWAADPFIGTWKMNIAKSKASDPSMMPKNETVKNVAQENGFFKTTFDGVDATGKAYHIEWSGKYDGKDYPATGDPNVDMSAAKKVDANTVVAVDKKAGKEVATWRVTVSKDGKIETVAGKGKDAKGQAYTMDLVYDKQ